MKRIIIHHTGGSYRPNSTDRKAYHFLIDGLGNITTGVYKVSDNENCKDGKYAAHTLNGNTGSIGVAACCNFNFNTLTHKTPYPFLKEQFNSIVDLCAELCKEYNIDVENVFTHYWFDKCNNINQGKSDIIFLPWKPDLKPNEIIYYFRDEIRKLL